MSKKGSKKGQTKETTKKETRPPKKKKQGMLYDMDVRELLVMFIAANFLLDGLIIIILVTKLYL